MRPDMRPMTSRARLATFGIVVIAATAGLAACKDQQRELRTDPPQRERRASVRTSVLQPGEMLPALSVKSFAEGNAYQISEGQRLFGWYNCAGCHGPNGGGGMGPPLTDSVWIYGADPANLYETITHGRPNGMPSFAGHIPDEQVWQLVAYVRSLGQLEPGASISQRRDYPSKVPEAPTP